MDLKPYLRLFKTLHKPCPVFHASADCPISSRGSTLVFEPSICSNAHGLRQTSKQAEMWRLPEVWSLNGPTLPQHTHTNTRLTLSSSSSDTTFTPYCNVPTLHLCVFTTSFLLSLLSAILIPALGKQQQVAPLSLQKKNCLYSSPWRKRGANMATCCL